jgi:iron complex outermembrane recepter protein
MATKKTIVSMTAALLSAGLCSSIASAAVLEEVVVTSQKREQNLQDVGIAVTAFTGEQMNALGIKQSFDIAAFSPGVHISGNLAGQNVQFTIRGVTQNDFNDIVEAPNAVYLDEGYLAIAQAQTFAVYDVERVEILKGPQGTLFGRNATGGLVHYISNKPNFDEVEGYVDFTYGQYDTDANANQYTVEAAVGGPLTDMLAGRFAMRYNQQEAYLKNLYPDGAFGGSPGPGAGADLGDDDTLAVRATLAFQPNDTSAYSLSINHSRTDVATGPYQSIPTIGVYNAGGELINVIDVAAGETRAGIAADGSDFGADTNDDGIIDYMGRLAPGADLFGYKDPDGDDFTFSSDFAFEDQGHTENFGINLRGEWDLSAGVTLTSVTDFKDYDKLLFIDVDSAPVNQLANYAAVDAQSFTQEIRANGESDSARWVGGFFYLKINNDADNGLKVPNAVDVAVDATLKTDSYSLFGQIEWDLTADLMLTTGLRIMQEEKDYEMAQGLYASSSNFSIHQGARIQTLNTLKTDSSDTFWTGKIQLDYQANDDLLIYGGINRGVKAGSFNAPLAGTFFALPNGNADIPYDEEVLLSYEAGFKSTILEGTTRFNGSVFYYDYNDYQAFLFTGVGGVVINSDATNLGAELELQTSPAEGWDAMFSVAWFDAEVEDVPLRVGSTISRDVKPTYAPELQVTALIRYEWVAMQGLMAIQGDISYSDEFYYNLRNFDADKFDSYVLSNARLRWASNSEHWEGALSVRNLTDERAGVQGFDLASLCGCNEVSYRAPRSYAVNVKYNF